MRRGGGKPWHEEKACKGTGAAGVPLKLELPHLVLNPLLHPTPAFPAFPRQPLLLVPEILRVFSHSPPTARRPRPRPTPACGCAEPHLTDPWRPTGTPHAQKQARARARARPQPTNAAWPRRTCPSAAGASFRLPRRGKSGGQPGRARVQVVGRRTAGGRAGNPSWERAPSYAARVGGSAARLRQARRKGAWDCATPPRIGAPGVL